MKVVRIDTACGEYFTLTTKEMEEMFSCEQIEAFKSDKETAFVETPYTVKQLEKARRLHSSEDYCGDYEYEHGISPDVYDILKTL